jgi:hypothetical protein
LSGVSRFQPLRHLDRRRVLLEGLAELEELDRRLDLEHPSR